MKYSLAAGTALFVAAVLLGLAQLWLAWLDADVFVKLEMTITALIGIVIVVSLVIRESREDKATRSGNSLD